MQPFAYAHQNVTAQMIINVRVSQYDPTRTTSLRNRFAAEMKKRLRLLASDIALELTQGNLHPYELIQTNAGSVRNTLNDFISWIKRVVKYRILGETFDMDESTWQNKYIQDAYKQGVLRARAELTKAGYKVPSVESSGGIMSIMNSPEHARNISLLYGVAYKELQNIASSIEATITRLLSDGVLLKKTSAQLAKETSAAIKSSKVLTVVRTEVVKSHHTANVQEYTNWGAEYGEVIAEFTTAGDDKVCGRCSGLQGTTYKMSEAMGLIPVHPNCRCFLKPINKTA